MMKMRTFGFLLTHPGVQIPAFWGRQVKSQPSQTAVGSSHGSAWALAARVELGAPSSFPSPPEQGCGAQGEPGWAAGAACGATDVCVLLLYPGSSYTPWDMALGSSLGAGGDWIYLGVSRRESLIALGRWPD